MRITGGEYKGRVIKTPNAQYTRPMTDKVRAALFNILGPLDGLSVLDVYAGSGALGFESLSRGVDRASAIESGRVAADTIWANAQSLGVENKFILHKMTVEIFLSRGLSKDLYDLILADPPYANIDLGVLAQLGTYLSPNGLLAISHDAAKKDLKIGGMRLVDNRVYGDTAVSFCRRAVA